MHANDPEKITSAPRFFVPALPAVGEVVLPTEEAHHARKVLRLRVGDAVELFDGCGRVATGGVAAVDRNNVTIGVQNTSVSERALPAVHVAFAVPKGKRLDWLLEKATELGAASLRPVIFQRSVAGPTELTGAKQAKWQGHCIAAAKQCGLNFLPELHPPMTLTEFLEIPASGTLRILGATDSLADTLRKVFNCAEGKNVVLLIGPEGGLTDEEIATAVTAGFRPVRLGRTTLRIETAVVALIAGVQAMR